METRDLKHLLMHHAKECKDLADKLTEKNGEPLSPEEYQLCRMVTVPLLQETFDCILATHLQGKDIAHWLERMSDISG